MNSEILELKLVDFMWYYYRLENKVMNSKWFRLFIF